MSAAGSSALKSKGFLDTFYRLLVQRNSTFILLGVAGAFVLERMVDVTCDTIFDKINEGKQFRDLVKKLENKQG